MGSRSTDQSAAAAAAHDPDGETAAAAWIKAATWAEVIDMMERAAAYFDHMVTIQTDEITRVLLRNSAYASRRLAQQATDAMPKDPIEITKVGPLGPRPQAEGS